MIYLRHLLFLILIAVNESGHAYDTDHLEKVHQQINDLLGEISPDERERDIEDARDKLYKCFLTEFYCVTSGESERTLTGHLYFRIHETFKPTETQIKKAERLNLQYKLAKYRYPKSAAENLMEQFNDLLGEVTLGNRESDLEDARDEVYRCFIDKKCTTRGPKGIPGFRWSGDFDFEPTNNQIEEASKLLRQYEYLRQDHGRAGSENETNY